MTFDRQVFCNRFLDVDSKPTQGPLNQKGILRRIVLPNLYQIFLGTTYQNGGKYTQNIPNEHKIY
jgi:hypothetical protein